MLSGTGKLAHAADERQMRIGEVHDVARDKDSEDRSDPDTLKLAEDGKGERNG